MFSTATWMISSKRSYWVRRKQPGHHDLMSSEIASAKVYTSQFWLLCLSSLLFFASFNMLIPELPAYLTSLGGAQHKGLIISLFTLTAMISRPFSGKLADTIGRVPVMIIGTAVCFVCSLCYPILASVAGFLA